MSKELIKFILKYIVIFLGTVSLLIILMLTTLICIPRSKIEANIVESINRKNIAIEYKIIKEKRVNEYLHKYADDIILNITYCMDNRTPLKSIMQMKVCAQHDVIEGHDLKMAVEEKSNGNIQYLRYWHGSTTIIRLLLVFFNINQIYIFFAIILIILLSYLYIILLRKRNYILIIAMIVGLIMTFSHYVPFCLEYTWSYLIMLIISIIGTKIEKKGNQNVNVLMFITGIVICYLDFLSTETLTFSVPILIIFTIRYKEKRIKDIKKELKQMLIWVIMWAIGYCLMWMCKWILAGCILSINSLDYVLENAMVRINDPYCGESYLSTIIMSLQGNIKELYIFYLIEDKKIRIIIAISTIVLLILLGKKDKKEIKFALIALLIGLIPYIRYSVIAAHSSAHSFFTFRAQLVSVMAIVIAIYIIIDKNKLKKILLIRTKQGE